MYFCPEDATVGLKGVNGMGASGLPDTMAVAQAGAKRETVNILSDGFRQRLFTRRKRHGKPILVGTPPGPLIIREKGESAHGTSGATERIKRADIAEGTVRTINGEALPPAFAPDLEGNVLPGTENTPLSNSKGEREPGKQSIDQVEAEVALSASELQQLPPQAMAWPALKPGSTVPAPREVEAVLNQGKETDDQCKVLRVLLSMPPVPGQIRVIRQETPNEAKVRLMNELRVDSSYHSAVMSGRRNHRCATAFDVAIGQARALDDPEWAALLRTMADWRVPLKKVKATSGEERYAMLDHVTQDIVEANCRYYDSGRFPPEGIVPMALPAKVVSETLKIRIERVQRAMESAPLNNIPLL